MLLHHGHGYQVKHLYPLPDLPQVPFFPPEVQGLPRSCRLSHWKKPNVLLLIKDLIRLVKATFSKVTYGISYEDHLSQDKDQHEDEGSIENGHVESSSLAPPLNTFQSLDYGC